MWSSYQHDLAVRGDCGGGDQSGLISARKSLSFPLLQQPVSPGPLSHRPSCFPLECLVMWREDRISVSRGRDRVLLPRVSRKQK